MTKARHATNIQTKTRNALKIIIALRTLIAFCYRRLHQFVFVPKDTFTIQPVICARCVTILLSFLNLYDAKTMFFFNKQRIWMNVRVLAFALKFASTQSDHTDAIVSRNFPFKTTQLPALQTDHLIRYSFLLAKNP